MCLVMNEVVIRYFGVLRRAIDAESRDLAIWTIPEAQHRKITLFYLILLISWVWGQKIPYLNWGGNTSLGRGTNLAKSRPGHKYTKTCGQIHNNIWTHTQEHLDKYTKSSGQIHKNS